MRTRFNFDLVCNNKQIKLYVNMFKAPKSAKQVEKEKQAAFSINSRNFIICCWFICLIISR